MGGTQLTTEQVTRIFTRLSVVEDHKLKYLNLSNNNLSLVPINILVAGISSLKQVDLTGTKLTTEQLTGIYRMVADRRCSSLKKIYLYNNNYSSVSQDIQDRARLNESTEMITASV